MRLLFAATSALGPATMLVAQCVPVWSPVAPGTGGEVLSLAVDTTPTVQRISTLYVGGWFNEAGGVPARRFTHIHGTTWGTINHAPLTFNGAYVEAVLPWSSREGDVEPGIYVSGFLVSIGGVPVTNLARWDGQSWHDVGGGVGGLAKTLAAYDEDGEGPQHAKLFFGGIFRQHQSGFANSIVRWDGHEWTPMPIPIASLWNGSEPTVNAFHVHDDDGAGPRRPGLYVAGNFEKVGELPAANIARWDGAAWESLGLGVSNTVDCMVSFDRDASGPLGESLVVGGSFSQAGGVGSPNIAMWHAGEWQALGVVTSTVRALAVFDDDGPGPNPTSLFLTGLFSSPGSRIVKWGGVGYPWGLLGSGLGGGIGVAKGETMVVYDADGSGPSPPGLYVGGNFTLAGGQPALGIARWGCPLSNCYPDCNGDGAVNLADFGCFQTAFATGNMYADCNADLVLNLADFGCFQTRFVLGCQ